MRPALTVLPAALLCVGMACAQSTVATATTPAAAPAPAAADELGGFMSERGLLGAINEVDSKVGMQASDLVASTLGLLGVPYRRGGATLATGFDCSGFFS